MPLYDFECPACEGPPFEILVGARQRPRCRDCKRPLHRLPPAPAIIRGNFGTTTPGDRDLQRRHLPKDLPS